MKIIDVEAGEQFPLFSNIGLETSAVCNRHCVFCPNHDYERPDEYMDVSLIEKCLRNWGS